MDPSNQDENLGVALIDLLSCLNESDQMQSFPSLVQAMTQPHPPHTLVTCGLWFMGERAYQFSPPHSLLSVIVGVVDSDPEPEPSVVCYALNAAIKLRFRAAVSASQVALISELCVRFASSASLSVATRAAEYLVLCNTPALHPKGISIFGAPTSN